MKTIVTPASSQASITSSSRFEPPGWITAVAPAWIASSGPSAKGKKASEATASRPAGRGVLAAGVAALLDREADRVDAAHLAGADADVAPSLAITIAFERTCRQTVQAKQHVVPLLLARLGLGHDLHDLARLGVAVPVLDEQAAADPLDVALARVALAALLLAEDPDRLLLLQHLEGVVLVAGRDQHLDEVLVQRLGELLVDRPVEGDHAAEGRHRVAGERLLVGLERVRRRSPPRRGCCA